MQCGTAIGGSAHDGDDFFFESARVSSVTTALMASYGIGVQRLLRMAIFFSDHLGANELAEVANVVLVFYRLRCWVGGDIEQLTGARIDAHRAARHAFYTRCDNEVLGAGHNSLGCKLNTLLRRSTLSVNRHCRHTLRQVGGEDSGATDLIGLLARLRDTTYNHVFNRARVYRAVLDNGVECLST